MDLTSIKNLKQLFTGPSGSQRFNPTRLRGQNFLVDKNVLNYIIETSGITEKDWVLEVGAGAGTLTQELAKIAQGVLTAEIDSGLTPILAQTVGSYKSVRIFKGDALSRDFHHEIEKWKQKNRLEKFKIITNLPYQITSIFLRVFLPRPDVEFIFMMIQKEVAKRIISQKGDHNMLSLSVQFYSQPKLLKTVSKNCFWPAPNVDSALILLETSKGYKAVHKVSPQTEENMFRVMKVGFAAKRKQLQKNLSSLPGLVEKGFDPSKIKAILLELGLKENIRAQELDLPEWQALAEKLF